MSCLCHTTPPLNDAIFTRSQDALCAETLMYALCECVNSSTGQSLYLFRSSCRPCPDSMMIQPKSIVQLMASGPDERRQCNHLSLLSENLQYRLRSTHTPGKYLEKGANLGIAWCKNKAPKPTSNLLSGFGQLSALELRHFGNSIDGHAVDENHKVSGWVPCSSATSHV